MRDEFVAVQCADGVLEVGRKWVSGGAFDLRGGIQDGGGGEEV